jgi:hypothetical protein
MSEILVPYTQFEAADLAHQLNEAVLDSIDLLEQRNLHGVVARYGGRLSLAEVMVEKGQWDHLKVNPAHFAVMNKDRDVIGAASIYPNLPLRKLHLPLPPKFTNRFLSDQFSYANPNISAWTKSGEEEVLMEAYKQMVTMGTTPVSNGYMPHESPWTIEPIRSPREIHAVIALAGLTKIATRRFDDGESKTRIPPRSTLYAKLNGKWITAHGKQKELRKGQSIRWWDIGQNEDDEFDGIEIDIGS